MAIFIVVANMLMLGVLSVRLLNYIQLGGYKYYYNKVETKHYIKIAIATVVGLIAMLGLGQIQTLLFECLSVIAFFVPYIVVAFWDILDYKKTPLVVTKRIVRYYILFEIITLVVSLIMIYGSKACGINESMFIFIPYVLLPIYVRLVMVIIEPLEQIIKLYYLKKARRVISERQDLCKIGITGSYGKTSVKEILKQLLSNKFSVVSSPSSFNTPMGAVKTISNIKPDTQVLIMEMGARQPKDISKLCEIITPNIGIITGIASQHLETFKSINNIIDTKYELIESLPSSGFAVFNGNNEHVKRMFNRCKLNAKNLMIYDYGYIHTSNVNLNAKNTQFTLHIGADSIECNTVLLGRHNIENILLGVYVASYLGMNIAEIAEAVHKLEYCTHRLEIINADNNVTILDDSYNANPEGVKVSLEALARFKNRKVIMTQGMVELGEEMERENYNLGVRISQVADIVIAIGSSSNIIIHGLLESGYNPTKIIQFISLKEAMQKLPEILKAEDVLLIMNDLPDNY